MYAEGCQLHRSTSSISTLSSASVPGNGPLLDFDEAGLRFQKLDLVALHHEDEVIGGENDVAQIMALLGEDADAGAPTLADQDLVAGRQVGYWLGGHVVVGERRAAGFPFKHDDLERPRVIGDVRFGGALQDRVADVIGFADVLDFLFGVHKRGELAEFPEVVPDVDGDDPVVIGRAEILDGLGVESPWPDP